MSSFHNWSQHDKSGQAHSPWELQTRELLPHPLVLAPREFHSSYAPFLNPIARKSMNKDLPATNPVPSTYWLQCNYSQATLSSIQSASQPASQPASQSVIHSSTPFIHSQGRAPSHIVSQSVSRSAGPPMSWLIGRSVGLSIGQLVSPLVAHSPTLTRPSFRSDCQPVTQSVGQPVNQ